MSKACCDFAGVGDVAGEHDAVADALDADVGSAAAPACSAARTPLRSRVTAMSKPAICWPSASKK